MKKISIVLFLLCVQSASFSQWQCVGFAGKDVYTIQPIDNRLYTFIDSVIYVSDDKGASWDSISVLNNRFLTSLIPGNHVLFASSCWACAGSCVTPLPCIFSSLDNGVTWNTVYSFPGGVCNIVYNQGAICFVNYLGFHMSVDNGATWNLVEPDSSAPLSFGILYSKDDVLFNISSGSGVHQSLDRGMSWTDLTKDLPQSSANSFFVNSDYLFLSVDGGYYRAFKDELSWEAIGDGLPVEPMSPLFFGNDEHLIVEDFGDLYYSPDNGETWRQMDRDYRQGSDLHFLILDVMVLDNDMFVATENGIWRYDLSIPVNVESDHSAGLSDYHILSNNYPNPFNPLTTIHYHVNQAGPVSLQVFDVRGVKVAELVKRYQLAGDYSVDFDANGLASGIYFYRLQYGESNVIKKMTLLR